MAIIKDEHPYSIRPMAPLGKLYLVNIAAPSPGAEQGSASGKMRIQQHGWKTVARKNIYTKPPDGPPHGVERPMTQHIAAAGAH